MCGACGSNRPVSALTAELNERKLKAPFAAHLSSLIAPHSVRPFGDRWQLRSPTGRVELFEDVEELLAALGERGHGLRVEDLRLRKICHFKPAGPA